MRHAQVGSYQLELEWEVLGFDRRTIHAEPTIRCRCGEPAPAFIGPRVWIESEVVHLNTGERLVGFPYVHRTIDVADSSRWRGRGVVFPGRSRGSRGGRPGAVGKLPHQNSRNHAGRDPRHPFQNRVAGSGDAFLRHRNLAVQNVSSVSSTPSLLNPLSKLASRDASLTTLVVRDLALLEDQEAIVRLVAVKALQRLNATIAVD